MERQYRPTTYLTAAELFEMATIKLQEAAITPEGPRQQNILREAQALQARAQLKATQLSKSRAQAN
ncbi:hypothetical protein [Tardiphaga sp.]|jgi:hypothetical protein|uniref:hypothetical protein n=1 Tax=Tardiphaga sp. TaxID=1926292 RepID=UPI0026345BB9|nr:hypothetical protein [Tardiphaga sp.]